MPRRSGAVGTEIFPVRTRETPVRMERTEGGFDVALGRCTISDGSLHIDGGDPETLSRWALFRSGVATNATHRPRYTAAMGLVIAGLLVVFLGILGWLYIANPAVLPLVVVLAILGMLSVLGPFEIAYRRALRAYRERRRSLDAAYPLSTMSEIPLDAIQQVTIRPVESGPLLTDGHLLLVHVDDGMEAVTYVGFPSFMEAELATAERLFEANGLPVTHGSQQE